MSKNQKSGFAISSLAGDAGDWAVTMSQIPSLSIQRLVGYDFNQTQLKSNMDEGFRIRSVAGFGEKRKDWIKAR